MPNKQKLELTWIGKENQPKLEPRILIEDPEKSYGDKNSENMLIYGDNLLALKALEQDFAGQIKCACIDPPYNTGNAFEHYDDGLEHSIWLSLIKPRIEILHRLLRKDGTLWITIDDTEAHYLKVLCDEIFGRNNFVASVIWHKKHTRSNDARWFSDNHDFILVYAKDKLSWKINKLPRTEKQDKGYTNPDNDPRDVWASGPCHAKTPNPKDIYPITTPSGRVIMPPSGTSWRFSKKNFEALIKDNRIYFGISGNNVPQKTLFGSEVRINVFNISKINAETRGNKEPRIKRLSEYLGDSYFNYLSNINDLVLLMDESHHYRADRGMQVINELNPILGLELTATPQVERSGGAIKFKNVVYEYSLAKAIKDGFVKEPAVATRKDFDPSHYSIEDLDRIKLEDGIRIHEDTKVALNIYARDNRAKEINPFVLVVAKDTNHADQLKELITSNAFFEGYYAGKVMEIHSNQTGGEKEENIAQLILLENPDNTIEIVIHVNMLKEGWDVTNLYTIIPLRTAASMTLREQTIGRGLRLPYGKRTGSDKVDKLTIVAHDKFKEIIEEANKPDSIIRRENIIEIDEQELSQQKEVITSFSNIEKQFEEEQKKIEEISQPEERQKAEINLEVRKLIISTLPELSKDVANINELNKSEIKRIAVEKIKQKIYSDPQRHLFAEKEIKEVENAYETVVSDFVQNIIEIPRITIQQSDEVSSGFEDFDLDANSLNYQPVSEEILVKKLREQENNIDTIIGKGRIVADNHENTIVNELINFPEIDYDEQADFLFKLAGQAVGKFKTYLDEDKLMNVVQFHKKEIGQYIYSQLMQHFYCKAPSYEKPVVKPFTRIEEHNFSKYTKDSIHHYTETITPTSAIPGKVFSGFNKACHSLYKFDSKTEKDFAIVLEQDTTVLKWLRPASSQFNIYWKHNSNRYCPDFVVQQKDTIYLVETKKSGDIETTEVQEKAQAALQYCQHATEFTAQNGGKPWKYVLIPHNAVMLNMSFDVLVKQNEYNGL